MKLVRKIRLLMHAYMEKKKKKTILVSRWNLDWSDAKLKQQSTKQKKLKLALV